MRLEERNRSEINSSMSERENQEEQLNNRNGDIQDLMHQRLGHLGLGSMKKLQDSNAVLGMDHFKVDTRQNRRTDLCRACVLGKADRFPFRDHTRDKAEQLIDRAHADVWTISCYQYWGK